MVRWLLFIVSIVLPVTVFSKPDLSSYLDLKIKSLEKPVRVYRDHKNSRKWYFTPIQVRIGSENNPGYSLDLMRYKGRKGSGDAQKFWVKSVLHLELDKAHGKSISSLIRKAIKIEGYKITTLKKMPEYGARLRVVMGDLESNWSTYSKWNTKDIAIALSDHMAQILWGSAEKQQQLMSVEVQTKMIGVQRDQHSKVDKDESGWVDDQIFIAETLSVVLDSEKHPERFRRTDLDANIDFGYTGLDVFCFDFLEGNYPELYAILVDIKITHEDRDMIKQLRFDKNSDYRFRIDFGIAKSIDAPYLVRMTYIDKKGIQRQEPWFNKRGELMLDVTRYEVK
ncbi:MAG: hypothetical protein D6B28_05195 [Gammaproteobacteria bacterium]|nr:MAG: hypothetical protein D6B28_05195 [Gammaproteobacteria bacterium]